MRASRFREMWKELRAYAVPPSIVQQDFREGHVIMTDAGPLFFDWSDTVVSHPFFSATRYLQSLPMSNEQEQERGRRIRDAYLEPWTAFEPRERLIEALDLARALNPLYQAVRWYLALPYVEPGCPWRVAVARAVPQELRATLRPTAP
jgi:aminoglycoside phosphotransferase (APT) family kinase protein